MICDLNSQYEVSIRDVNNITLHFKFDAKQIQYNLNSFLMKIKKKGNLVISFASCNTFNPFLTRNT